MRAYEFVRKLTEADMHHYHHQAIPGAKTFPGMGQSYDMYRFSIALAGSPDHEHPITDGTDATDNPATISYSQGDEDKINKALAATGRSSVQVSGRGSREPDDTHKVSPVLSFPGVKRKSGK
jgi:hypothetical protein